MRRFSGILLAMGLLLAAGCGGRKTGSIHIDPALASLVPSDTTMLAGVQMEALRNTPVYQKCAAAQEFFPLNDFVKRTGLDPRQDIGEMLVASNGKDMVAMARGKFASAGFASELEKAGAKRSSYKGYTLIVSPQLAVVFLDAVVALAGPPAALRSILDRRSHGGGRIPSALARQIDAVPSPCQLWVTALGPFSGFSLPLSKNDNLTLPAPVLASTASVTAFADLRAAVDISATAASFTEQDAKRLHDCARGFIGLGRLSVPDNQPDMLRFFDGIQVEQQQRLVSLRVQVPLDLLDRLIRTLPRRH
jgi:hypothetical protein